MGKGETRDAIVGEELKLGSDVFNWVGQEDGRELGDDGGDVSRGETVPFEKLDHRIGPGGRFVVQLLGNRDGRLAGKAQTIREVIYGGGGGRGERSCREDARKN